MVFFGLDEEKYDRKYNDRELGKRIFNYFLRYKKQTAILIVFLILQSIFTALQPLYMYWLINQLDGINEFTITLIWGLIILLVIHTVTFGFSIVRSIQTSKVLNGVIRDVRTDVTTEVLKQDMAFFDEYSTGKIVSRVNTDTQNMGEMVSILFESLSSIFSIVFLVIPMVTIDNRLTIVFLCGVPLVFILTSLFRKYAKIKTLLGQRATASVNAFVQESLAGIQNVKTFRQEEKLYDEFNEINLQSYKVNFSRAMLMNMIFPMLFLIEAAVLAVSVSMGGKIIISTPGNVVITPTQLYLFIQTIWGVYYPIFQIAAFWPQFQVGMAAAERTFSLIDSKPKVVQNNAILVDSVKGEIEFRNLQFNYVPEKPIFKDFSLHIQPGESVAIVGHTGAGKSSLTRLLMRFYEYQSGQILIDGKDLRDLDLDHYRLKVGMIPQVPFLWSDTLENNVKYGSPEATRDQVWWALNQAGGAEWVYDLPDGLDTNIRERGRLLSMGQRQLVVFARILLQNPSILVLDEATASVDPFTETRIQEAMETLMKGRTSIVIAHRLRTVRHVDRILVFDHGRIIEEGSHDQLMKKGGTYANLYTKYFKHQSYEFLEKGTEHLHFKADAT